ncbi:MAG: histidinol phosphate phosphatase domain-containing protein [Desulfatibacillaceae bacterium]
MIDLHTHTVFSDGELIVSELARRAQAAGLVGLGITDHGDLSNMDFIIPRVAATADQLNQVLPIVVVPGIEITHVPPQLVAETVARARELGARLVVVHGETPVEPVAQGTNRAAIDAGCDILSHPGLISREDVEAARERGVLLEISGRKGHCLTNGHVARLAMEAGARMVVNSDTHAPGDLMNADRARLVVRGAGLDSRHFDAMQDDASRFL